MRKNLPAILIISLLSALTINKSGAIASSSYGTVMRFRLQDDPPAILVHPTAVADCKGNKVTFSVQATGTLPLHYLWEYKRPEDPYFSIFNSADSVKLPVYSIGTGAAPPSGSLFRVTVTNTLGFAISDSAILIVNEITGIVPTGIASHTLCVNDSISLMVKSSGNQPSGYQWIKRYGPADWRNLPGSTPFSGVTGPRLLIDPVAAEDSGIYKVRVTFPTINGNFCTETSTITRTLIVNEVKPGLIGFNQMVLAGTAPDLICNIEDARSKTGLINYSWLWQEEVTPGWQPEAMGIHSTLQPGVLIANRFYKREASSILNGKLCKAESSNHVKMTVGTDTSPPWFSDTTTLQITFCPEDPDYSRWNYPSGKIVTDSLYRSLPPSIQLFDLGDQLFRDDYDDNSEMTIHWSLYSLLTGEAVQDSNNLPLENRSGQPSSSPVFFNLQATNERAALFRWVYWLSDRSGNLTPLQNRKSAVLTILPRPAITASF